LVSRLTHLPAQPRPRERACGKSHSSSSASFISVIPLIASRVALQNRTGTLVLRGEADVHTFRLSRTDPTCLTRSAAKHGAPPSLPGAEPEGWCMFDEGIFPHEHHQQYPDVGNQCFTLVGWLFYVVLGISLPTWCRISCVPRMKYQLRKDSFEATVLGFERRDSQSVSEDVSYFGDADERRSFRLLIHVQQIPQVDLGCEPAQGHCA
jgi:hypothetical protein